MFFVEDLNLAPRDESHVQRSSEVRSMCWSICLSILLCS